MTEEEPYVYYEEGEHPCERLVRIVQGREPGFTKVQREDAFAELLEMFRPLITKVAMRTYEKYRYYLKREQDYQSWYHDTVTTMVELVLRDFLPKKYGGKAMFGPYIKTKLWFRQLYEAQKIVKKCSREPAMDTRPTEDGGDWLGDGQVHPQIMRALYAQITSQAESAFEVFDTQQIRGRIDTLRYIAKHKLSPYDYFIWHSTIFSEKTTSQVAESLPQTDPDGKPLSRNQKTISAHFQRARDKVLLEYAKLQIAGKI